jgi:hypothetical protein
LRKLRSLLAKGLEQTRSLWPDIRSTYRWVHAAARILKNTAGRAAEDVKARYARLLEEWHKRKAACGRLGDAVDRFLKVTGSYRPGLFHYLEVPDLPATNNGLEQFFGAQRHHERPAARSPRPAWSCAARCASSPPRSPAWPRSAPPIWPLSMSGPGSAHASA